MEMWVEKFVGLLEVSQSSSNILNILIVKLYQLSNTVPASLS